MLGDHNYSLTAQAAFWAGSIEPQERGDSLVIKIVGLLNLSESVQKHWSRVGYILSASFVMQRIQTE